ncbi:MAG TPA: trypsin-like peptidase domain-containing protein [Acidimicrobiales bacterium]|nr:trypsin-like peptidase domain-containing protein [Acidimicrobiales bacterium]
MEDRSGPGHDGDTLLEPVVPFGGYAPDVPPHERAALAPLDTPPLAGDPLPPLGGAPAAPDGPARPTPSGRARGAALLVAVALLGGVTGSALTRALDDPAATGTAAGADRSLLLDGARLDVAAVVAKAAPAVVSIQAGSARFGATSAGTGVILTADGEILTNAHVVEGATSVQVTLAGESRSRAAEVVGSDPSADLALVRIPGATGLPTADLGSSAAVAVGDDVVAIGNALALRGGPSVTRGIVSALDRSLDTEAGTITGLIQTDASISSGNSGGPLVNAAGQVIGINTAVAASSRGTAAENIGFAIAVDQALPVVERLRGNATAAEPGYLGVQTADPADGSRGATVVSVEAGSPAATAGLEVGDLVTRVADRSVDGAAALRSAIRSHQPGETIEVEVVRGDGQEPRMLKVTLGSR